MKSKICAGRGSGCWFSWGSWYHLDWWWNFCNPTTKLSDQNPRDINKLSYDSQFQIQWDQWTIVYFLSGLSQVDGASPSTLLIRASLMEARQKLVPTKNCVSPIQIDHNTRYFTNLSICVVDDQHIWTGFQHLHKHIRIVLSHQICCWPSEQGQI